MFQLVGLHPPQEALFDRQALTYFLVLFWIRKLRSVCTQHAVACRKAQEQDRSSASNKKQHHDMQRHQKTRYDTPCTSRGLEARGTLRYTCATLALHLRYTCATLALHLRYTCATRRKWPGTK